MSSHLSIDEKSSIINIEVVWEKYSDVCVLIKALYLCEGHVMPVYVHMLVSIPPRLSVSSFMGYLKGKSALMMFDKHANLKYKFGNRHFWAEGYYVSTVGLNEATIKKYIQEQEKHDIALDKLSVKEYEDPFRDNGK
ncbi:IS200/IS605 family transposase [Streptococcus suis]|uniref:IS200/IS605 family transposase n=1 Tax=Streptococcus suis TaxID=1307 RepID=UPI002284B7A2|nr:IS200/IS605 family transposase [Streptococcus suis]